MHILPKVDSAAGALAANSGSLLFQLSFIEHLNSLLQTITLFVNLAIGLTSAVILYRNKKLKAAKVKAEIEKQEAINKRKNEDLQDDREDKGPEGEETPGT